jgi:DNA polymerase III subunit alpha
LGAIPVLLTRLKQERWQLGQMSLFGWEATGGNTPPSIHSAEEWSLPERLAAQVEILGISVDAHPLEMAASQIAALHALTTSEAVQHMGKRVTVAGVRMAWRRSRAEKGGMMAFLTLEDLEGMLDVIIYPDVYRRIPPHLPADEPLLVTGIVEPDPARGEPLMVAERVMLLGKRAN